MLVLGGKIVAGTEWILGWRETGLLFDPSKYSGCRKRKGTVRHVVGHWTGGEAGTTNGDDDGKRVYDALRGRKDADGKPAPLSIHFTIGATGKVWQHADALSTVAFHAGAVNETSIGIEVVSKGFPPSDPGRPRPEVEHVVHGRKVRQVAFLPSQIESYVRLCAVLSRECALPMRVPGKGVAGEVEIASDRIPDEAVQRWSGFLEHLHVSSSKADAGTQLSRALREAGFVASVPS